MFAGRHKHDIDVADAQAGHRAGHLELVDVREDDERARGFAWVWSGGAAVAFLVPFEYVGGILG
jgi:hypothetical protein